MNEKMRRCYHPGQEIRIGRYSVLAGARFDIRKTDFSNIDVLVALTEHIPYYIWLQGYLGSNIWSYPIQDYYGPIGPWNNFLKQVIKAIKRRKRVFVFCDGGHGRTGLFLASLIMLLERKNEDPITATRIRYCEKAVETIQQAECIFALRGREVPEKYKNTLMDADSFPIGIMQLFLKRSLNNP